MKKIILFVALLGNLLLVGCGGRGGGIGGWSGVDKVSSFVNLLNQTYGYYQNFYVVKQPYESMTEGFVVVYSPSSGYTAYDIASYYPGQSWADYSYYSEYSPVYIHGIDTDYYTGEVFYFGDAYTNGYYPIYRGEFVFDETTEMTKDLEKAQAIKEAYGMSNIANSLAAEYGLSEERSLKVAKLASTWKKLSRTRSMTEADANNFSKEVLGVSIDDATSAVERHDKGDDSKMKEVVKKAANVNGISPEHMSQIVNEIIN